LGPFRRAWLRRSRRVRRSFRHRYSKRTSVERTHRGRRARDGSWLSRGPAVACDAGRDDQGVGGAKAVPMRCERGLRAEVVRVGAQASTLRVARKDSAVACARTTRRRLRPDRVPSAASRARSLRLRPLLRSLHARTPRQPHRRSANSARRAPRLIGEVFRAQLFERVLGLREAVEAHSLEDPGRLCELDLAVVDELVTVAPGVAEVVAAQDLDAGLA
jgi:hypothetical protein